MHTLPRMSQSGTQKGLEKSGASLRPRPPPTPLPHISPHFLPDRVALTLLATPSHPCSDSGKQAINVGSTACTSCPVGEWVMDGDGGGGMAPGAGAWEGVMPCSTTWTNCVVSMLLARLCLGARGHGAWRRGVLAPALLSQPAPATRLTSGYGWGGGLPPAAGLEGWA